MPKEIDDMNAQEAYLEGRLLGLNELISILKDAMQSDKVDQSILVKSIVLHISNEMSSILNELKEEHGEHPTIQKAEKQTQKMSSEAEATEGVKDEKAVETLKKNVNVADDLMKNLLSLKENQE
ncbi:MAG: hypothetical protein M1594_02185 [Candidatus Marsarchaeota archaeon]|nr:hypothetical protein [Candidatus Marsarchaeota archaeon]